MMETYHGFVRTPADAIKLFEACRIGLLPRVQRRLSEKERQSIRSGSVFVWDEREAGMRRWTDGKSWSASRVSGSFLTYREMEGKRGGGFGNARRGAGKTPDSSGRGSDGSQDEGEPDGYRYKADGLMKQSFSITTSTGQHLHLISYYARPQPGHPELPNPSTDPSLRHIMPVKGMYPESSMTDAQVPPMTRTPMQPSPYMHGQPPPPHPGAHSYPHYVQHGYPNWPMSPATPPYSHHYTVAAHPGYPPPGQLHPPPPHHHYAPYSPPHPPPGHYEQQQQQQHQQQHQQQQQQQQHQQQHQHQQQRAPLPPPVTSAAQSRTPPMTTLPPYQGQQHAPPPNHHHSPHMSQPRAIPDGQHSQASPQPYPQTLPHPTQSPRQAYEARLAPVNPRSAAQGPLPPPTSTPPPRTASASPPRLVKVENGLGNNKSSSLLALLHPSSPTTNGSPTGGVASLNGTAAMAAAAAAAVANGQQKQTLPSIQQFKEDVRALGALDKKFLQT
ncbi:hypothetical protein RB594_009309 [Gaeumannomyces avenae]